jgi:hypothetical protein
VNSREPVSVISARDMSLIGLKRVKRALNARQRHRIMHHGLLHDCLRLICLRASLLGLSFCGMINT